MKRAALIAGISIATFSSAPTVVWAWSGDSDSWSRGDRPVSTYTPTPAVKQTARPRVRKPERHEQKADKTPPIPSGLLHIIVSIDKQRATLFADGASVASTAISTGTADHPTPMGVFTVIQKDRHHVSNLYNAPMPYMQRFTWSGSALHEGPLPGYPASHGCVRLTTSFAQLLWKATKMGARIIVTRPEVTPLTFEHPRLFVPRPKMVEMPDIPLPAPRPVTAAPQAAPAFAVAVAVKPTPESPATRIRTADATSTIAATITSVVDSKPIEITPVETQAAEAKPVETTPIETQAAKTKPVETTPIETQAAEAKPAGTATVEIQGFEIWPVETAPVETQATETRPVETTPVETQAAEAKPVETTPVETQAAETKPVETAPVEIQATETQPVETTPVETQAAETRPAETTPVETQAVEAKPVPTIAAPAPIIVDERPKTMPATVAREANGRPISVFVSLKESKLYVRQGWKPLFDAPVSFEHPEQPIGTHVYTAMGFKVTGDGLRWTVVSIPSSTRRAAAAEVKSPNKGRKGHHERVKPIEVAGPLPSPTAALDRIVMPPELVERISEMITPGSSLIVSDNKLSDETGEYTDFIVLTR